MKIFIILISCMAGSLSQVLVYWPHIALDSLIGPPQKQVDGCVPERRNINRCFRVLTTTSIMSAAELICLKLWARAEGIMPIRETQIFFLLFFFFHVIFFPAQKALRPIYIMKALLLPKTQRKI